MVDTETSARVRHAAAVTEGATPLASAATQTVASTLGKYVPALLALLRAALTLDFKFPCPGTNDPQWTRYGGNSAYADYNQGQIYKKALGGEALIISPRVG